jgi:hypothetical protein
VKRARIAWTVVFLGITLTAIVMEVVAGIFHPAGTIPWTEYLARYVPWPIQLAAYVVLVVWLPFHFWRHDHLRKAAYTRGVQDAELIALDTLARRNVADRCPSCDHTQGFHYDGSCRYAVTVGTVGANLVCPCTAADARF